MICHRCLLRAAAKPPRLAIRTFTTTSIRANATPVTAQTTTATNPRPHDAHPAATSTSAAQPFSEPLTPSLDRFPPKQSTSKPRVPSSVPAGTPLKGLNFLKNAQDPIAKEDHEYPDWLWGVLEKKSEDSGAGGRAGDGDLFSKSKKQRRIAAKALRKQQLLNPEMLQPKIPLYEQSVDLPRGDGTLSGAAEAAQARRDLTKAMRAKRRAKIKEDNFLKGMR